MFDWSTTAPEPWLEGAFNHASFAKLPFYQRGYLVREAGSYAAVNECGIVRLEGFGARALEANVVNGLKLHKRSALAYLTYYLFMMNNVFGRLRVINKAENLPERLRDKFFSAAIESHRYGYEMDVLILYGPSLFKTNLRLWRKSGKISIWTSEEMASGLGFYGEILDLPRL